MIRKIFSVMTAISLLALLALGESQRNSVAAQTLNSSRGTVPKPQVIMDITDMELFAPNSMRVAWTVQKIGGVTIDRYTVTLELSRNGVVERVGTTSGGAATSASVDLRGVLAVNRNKLFGPNLKVTAILKVDFTGKTANGAHKFVSDIQESKNFNAAESNPIMK